VKSTDQQIDKSTISKGAVAMKKWEPPSFVEVKMDAEIGAYQEDVEDVPEHSAARDERPIAPVPQ
jgi:hypothetical protein